MADVLPVNADAALRHIVKPGDQLAQGGLATAGGADHRQRLPCPDVEIHIVKHGQIPLIGKADVIHVHLSLHVPQLCRVRRVLHLRLRPHQLQKAAEAGCAVGQQLRKVGQPPHRVHEGGDIQAEGDEIHRVHLPPHDEESAHGDDCGREDAQEELHHCVEAAHGLVELPLGGLVDIIGIVELFQLLLLVGKGLGRADAGNAGLNARVDDGGFLLHLLGRLAHGAAAHPHHREKHRQNGRDHQGQPPLNGKHDGQCADDRHPGDENILRAMVSQLGDLKQLAGQSAHQRTGAVAVIIAKIQLLHMLKEIPADVRLH